MNKSIRTLSFISFIEGVLAFLWLAHIPTNRDVFSPVRLASLLGILLISLGCLVIFIYAGSETKLKQKIEKIVNHKMGLFISFLFISLSFTLWGLILYKEKLSSIVDEAIYIRLLPITILGMLLCLQAGILFLIPNIHKDTRENTFGRIGKPALFLLGCFLAIWAFMSITHIGFVFDNVGLSWGPPGTPITFAQVNLVFIISVLLAFAYTIFRLGIYFKRLPLRNIVIFLGFWGLAVILWWNTPVSETHFNPPIASPNYETYPNSDALIFDRSSYHLINGIGFNNQLIRRPLYVGMLALFHTLGGFTYNGTILFQILILAFIPSLTYLLTSKLSNRLAGLIAGGLILLREKNSIELSDKIVTANAKLMMSDMVAMLGVIAFVYVMVKVLLNKERSMWLLGIAGACLGLTALIRAQVLILIPVLVLFILMDGKPISLRIKDTFLIIIGLVLVMSPWIWRNWNLTGTFVLDDQGEEKLLARNYSANPVAFPPTFPGETEKEYSARIKRGIFTYIVEHPTDVMFFVSNHFLRNLATSAVYIAPSYSTDSPHGLISHTSFWYDWDGSLTESSPISIFINLAIIALGISIVLSKNQRAGWFPLAVLFFYSAGNALVRTSGWRFSLPVDWVLLVYYSIALAYLPSKIKQAFSKPNIHQPESEIVRGKHNTSAGFIIFFILFLVGTAIPIAERMIPAKDFSDLTINAKEKFAFENNITQEEIETFLNQDNAVLYSGIALYPRHIRPNSRIYLASTPKDSTFLHFWLINDNDNQIVLPIQSSPDAFPNVSTVSVIGCQVNGYLLAWSVIIHTPVERIILQDGQIPLVCAPDTSK